MIRVIVCDSNVTSRVKLRNAVECYATTNDIAAVEVLLMPSPQVLNKVLSGMRIELVDLIICRIEDDGALDVLTPLCEENPDLRVVLVSSSKDDAMKAFDLHVGFLAIPGDKDGFANSVGKKLDEISATRTEKLTVKSSAGLDTIPLNQLLFVESTKKGPLIHMPNGATVLTRGTLVSLANYLVDIDPRRFVKAGSSFLVNMDNVRSAGEGSLIFTGGETIIVPVRVRAALREAYEAYFK